MQIIGLHARCKRQQGKLIGWPYRTGRIRGQVGICAQQQTLPRNPDTPSADLAIRNSLEIRSKFLFHFVEHVLDYIETDATDKMNGARWM